MTYTLIRNGTLIDGTGRNPISDAAVLLDGNQIRAVGPLNTLTLPKADWVEIDAKQGHILPGLIDTHVHLMLEFDNPLKLMQTPFSLYFYKAISNMRRTIEVGITSVRDAGGADLGVKQAVEQGIVLGPRM